MNAKKLLKTLGIAAFVAAVTPYRIEKNEEKDEITCQALLWKLTNYPHPDFVDKRSTSLSIGFHPPVREEDCGCDCCCDEDDFVCCDESDFVCCDEDCCGCSAPAAEAPTCCCEEAPAE